MKTILFLALALLSIIFLFGVFTENRSSNTIESLSIKKKVINLRKKNASIHRKKMPPVVCKLMGFC